MKQINNLFKIIDLNTFLLTFPHLDTFLFKSVMFNMLFNSYKQHNIREVSIHITRTRFLSGGLSRANSIKDPITSLFFIPNTVYLNSKIKENVMDVDGTSTKFINHNKDIEHSLLMWEQFFCPGFVVLNNIGNWAAYLTKTDHYYIKYKWFSRNIASLLCYYLFVKNMLFQLNNFMPRDVIEKLFDFIQYKKDSQPENNFLYILCHILKKNSLFFDSFLFDLNLGQQKEHEKISYHGSWLAASNISFFNELKNWTRIGDTEVIDPYKLFYDFEDEIDFDALDLYLWPGVTSFDDFFSDMYDIIPSYQGLFRFKDIELFEYFFFLLRKIDHSDLNFWLPYIQVNFGDSIWGDVSKITDALIPRVFNIFHLTKWRSFFLLVIAKKLTAFCNDWFLWGLSGKDRRSVFFRFFFFFFCYLRGFFFKWFSVLLKQTCFHLPWTNELNYIIHILEQDQLFFVGKCKTMLEISLKDRISFLKNKYPMYMFWDFFFKQHFSTLVREKREMLYPNFMSILKKYLFKHPYLLHLFSVVVCCHIYVALFWELLTKKDLLLRYVYIYEKTLPKANRFFHQHLKIKDRLQNVSIQSKQKSLDQNYLFLGVLRRINMWKSFSKKKTFENQIVFFREGVDKWSAVFAYLQFLFIMICSRLVKYCFIVYMRTLNHVLAEYFLKQTLNYKQTPQTETQRVFIYGLKKGNLQNNVKQRVRVNFFSQFAALLEHIIYNFSLWNSIIFLYHLIKYVLLVNGFELFIRIYKFFWAVVYKFRLWKWKIKALVADKRSLLELKDWKMHQQIGSVQEAHKNHLIYHAFLRSQWGDNHDSSVDYKKVSWIVWFLNDNVKEIHNPFKDSIWQDILLLSFLFVFYRRIHRKYESNFNKLNLLINKFSFNAMLNNVFFFRVWRFFFSFIFFVVLRFAFISLVFLFVYFFVIVFSIISTILVIFTNLIWIIIWIVFLSLIYPVFKMIEICIRKVTKVCHSLWVLFVSCVLFVLEALGFFLYKILEVGENFFLVLVWKPTALLIDLVLLCKYRIFLVWLYLISAFSFFKKIFLIGFKIVVALFLFIAQSIFSLICYFLGTKETTVTWRFFISQETYQMKYDFYEFLYVFSFFFRFFFFLIGFFFFLIMGFGWSFSFLTYPDGSEMAKPEPSSYKAYLFLDQWGAFFSFLLLNFQLYWRNYCIWLVYVTIEGFVYIVSYGLYWVSFTVLFIKHLMMSFDVFKRIWIIFCKIKIWVKKIGICFCIVLLSLKELIRWPADKFILNSSKPHFYIYQIIVFRFFSFFYRKNGSVFLIKKLGKLFTNNKQWNVFFIKTKKYLLNDFILLRDIQEILVFAKFFYGFSVFYWAWVIQISIEIGDLGWWLVYKRKSHFKSFSNIDVFSKINFWKNRSKTFFLYDSKLNDFSSTHFYYLTFSYITKNITKYKPYIVNTFYTSNTMNFFKNTFFFKKRVLFTNFFRLFLSRIGFAFVFEILLQRFQHPVTQFIFGNVSSDHHWPVSLRLKYLKDFFTEFTWLVSYTYQSNMHSLDDFVWQSILNLRKYLANKRYYFTKFRQNWFLSLLQRMPGTFSDFLPRYRWTIKNLVFSVVVFCCYFWFFLCLCVFMLICSIVIVHFFFICTCYFMIRMMFRWFKNIFFFF